MDDVLKYETDNLVSSWRNNDSQSMGEYLVTGYENPRINIQSIRTRHFFIRELFGDEFDGLMEEEIRFGIRLHKALLAEEVRVLGTASPEMLNQPRYVRWRELERAVPSDEWDLFMKEWSTVLGRKQAGKLKVMEVACGSANDYRFMDAYGVARFLDYTGIDLTEANIRNAKQSFPTVDFQVGNALEIDAADDGCDYLLVSDLLEHLSPAGIDAAASEISRVAGKKALVNFFSMQDLTRHKINPVKNYHWNWLSRTAAEELFQRWWNRVYSLRITEFLESVYQFAYYYNRNAHTFILENKK